MNAKQIDIVMRSDRFSRGTYLGVFPADGLPKRITKYPSALVVNTDPRHLPGSHWVGFYFSADGKGEFMDSYGNPPGFYWKSFERLLKNNASTWNYNRVSLQHPLSDVCGQYVLFYLLHRYRGVSPNKILSMFGSNKTHNDRLLWKFIRKRL